MRRYLQVTTDFRFQRQLRSAAFKAVVHRSWLRGIRAVLLAVDSRIAARAPAPLRAVILERLAPLNAG